MLPRYLPIIGVGEAEQISNHSSNFLKALKHRNKNWNKRRYNNIDPCLGWYDTWNILRMNQGWAWLGRCWYGWDGTGGRGRGWAPMDHQMSLVKNFCHALAFLEEVCHRCETALTSKFGCLFEMLVVEFLKFSFLNHFRTTRFTYYPVICILCQWVLRTNRNIWQIPPLVQVAVTEIVSQE